MKLKPFTKKELKLFTELNRTIIRLCLLCAANTYRLVVFLYKNKPLCSEAPAIEDWIKCYALKPKKILNYVFYDMSKIFVGEMNVPFLDILMANAPKHNSNQLPDMLKTAQPLFTQIVEQSRKKGENPLYKLISILKMCEKELALCLKDKKQVDSQPTFTIKLPTYFFLYNWIPCIALYGQGFHSLLREAQRGDIESLEKLFRLDKKAIYESKIKTIWNQAAHGSNKPYFNRLTKALRETPKIPNKEQFMQFAVAFCYTMIDRKITSLKLQDFIDICYDLSRDTNNLFDISFYKSYDSFRMAVSRNKIIFEKNIKSNSQIKFSTPLKNEQR